MTVEVRRYLRKAEHALEVAEDLLKSGHAPDAASKNLLRHVLRSSGAIES